MKWINQYLPSWRVAQDDLKCIAVDGARCDYRPIPIHELKLTPLMRARINRYRKNPLKVSVPDVTKKLGVIVPYRHRAAHLKVFPSRLHEFLQKQAIAHEIIVVEQSDDGQPFNSGKLKNVGAKLLFDRVDYLCFHDIDMLPEISSYAFVNHPTLAATSIAQFDVHKCHSTYFSGAILFSKEDWLTANGFSNDYWHWGCEDDDLFLRCLLSGLTPVAYSNGRYDSLPHEKSITQTPDGQYHHEASIKARLQMQYKKNQLHYKKMRRGLIAFKEEGFNTLQFEVLAEVACEHYQKVIVKI